MPAAEPTTSMAITITASAERKILVSEYQGDPLRPDTETVTPSGIVENLSRHDRELRLARLIEQAHMIVDWAWETHGVGRQLAATCILFSGGNDSTCLTHLMRCRADYAVHCNTTIGIEATREFVRETCINWDLPLIEQLPPQSYRDLVKERGFPGPAFHFLYYTRLKERSLEAVRNLLVSNPRRERVLYIAGRRRSESNRRANVQLADRKGSMVFASPIAMWTKCDLVTYRAVMGDVPFNPVTDHLGMSGECLCGAFASDNELERIRFWYPDVAAEIDDLMKEVKAAGHEEPWCIWGHQQRGKGSKLMLNKVGMLCSSCTLGDAA